MPFGILTLATPDDYRKAIGLALSLRVSNPGVPTAVACSPKLSTRLAPYFDRVIDEDPTLRGFVHKVHLDRYSPFDDTFFFDSDVLVFRDLKPKVPNQADSGRRGTQVSYETAGKSRLQSEYVFSPCCTRSLCCAACHFRNDWLLALRGNIQSCNSMMRTGYRSSVR